MRIRYTGDIEELTVTPPSVIPFNVTRLQWVEVDDKVGKSLLAQPDWETGTTKARSAKTDKENS